MVLSKTRITKALIRLRRCAGSSAPLLFANHRRQVFSLRGPNHHVDIFLHAITYPGFTISFSNSVPFSAFLFQSHLVSMTWPPWCHTFHVTVYHLHQDVTPGSSINDEVTGTINIYDYLQNLMHWFICIQNNLSPLSFWGKLSQYNCRRVHCVKGGGCKINFGKKTCKSWDLRKKAKWLSIQCKSRAIFVCTDIFQVGQLSKTVPNSFLHVVLRFTCDASTTDQRTLFLDTVTDW